ncbi:MAG: type II toxin-antitoxin system VapC family toxin [Candidatus Korarchaeota archaeon]|nr:type II toxin-antitoxin system VapC family toxin [Candidatus Korarchaeota archaeon]
MKGRRIVVDSNILVKWFIPEDYHEEAKALLEDHLYGRVEVVIPRYAVLEFANVLRKYRVRRIIGEREVREAFDLLVESAPVMIEENEELVRKALDYSLERGLTMYDAYYMVLARELGAILYTADERVVRQLVGKESSLKHIREYVD